MYFINIIDGMYCVVNSFSNLIVAKFSRLVDAAAYIQTAQGLNVATPQSYGQFFNLPLMNQGHSHGHSCNGHNSCHGSNNNSCNHNNQNNNQNFNNNNNNNNFNNSQINSSIENQIRELSKKIDWVLEDKKEVLEEISILKSILSNSKDYSPRRESSRRDNRDYDRRESSRRDDRDYDRRDSYEKDSRRREDTYEEEYREERRPRKEEKVSKKEIKISRSEKPRGKGFRNLMIGLASITLIAGVGVGGYFAYDHFIANANPIGKPKLPSTPPRVGDDYFVEVKIKAKKGLGTPTVKVSGSATGEWTDDYEGKTGVLLKITKTGSIDVVITYGENTQSFKLTAQAALITVKTDKVQSDIQSTLKEEYKDNNAAISAIKATKFSNEGILVDKVELDNETTFASEEIENIKFNVFIKLSDTNKYKFESEDAVGPYKVTAKVQKPKEPTKISTKEVQDKLDNSVKNLKFTTVELAQKVIEDTTLDTGLKIDSVTPSKTFGLNPQKFDVVIKPLDENYVLESGKDSETFYVSANIIVAPVIKNPGNTSVETEKTTSLDITVENPDDGVELTATSSDEKIATVKLNENSLSITGVSEGSTKITLSYKGAEDVEFTVTVSKDLKEVSTKNVKSSLEAFVKDKEFENDEDAKTKIATVELDQGLEISDVSLKNSETYATEIKTFIVSVKAAVGYKIKENDDVSFEISANVTKPSNAVELSTVIENTKIEVDSGKGKDKTAILAAVKAANSSLDVTKVEVVIDGDDISIKSTDEKVYTGSVKITVTEKSSSNAVELSTVIENTKIEVDSGKGKDKTAILAAVKAANSSLDETKVEVVIDGDDISIKSTDEEVYTGSVKITITEKSSSNAVELSTVIENTKIEVDSGKGKDKTAILAAVKAANSSLDETKVEVVIDGDDISIKSTDEEVYTGSVKITVTEKSSSNAVELSTVIKNTQIEVDSGKGKDKAAILAAVKAANSSLDVTKVEVVISGSDISIKSIDEEVYTGSVEITVTEKES
ncbi:hypothetical protein [Spiroplasma endosymbiont of Diplazon laetatorius]|uniref:hypothetical protein n=1 Tax=Spiroplasma endosymbiont of Diplazon laetatorius TaxID=3066322 RepID=UPI0030CCBB98